MPAMRWLGNFLGMLLDLWGDGLVAITTGLSDSCILIRYVLAMASK